MSAYRRSWSLAVGVSACAFLSIGALAGPIGSAHVATDGASGSSTAYVVDDNGAQCPTAQYTTIQGAIAAAPAGATIKVCPGVYQGPVVVSKPLTIVGPKGVARQRKAGDSKHQAIVVGGTNGDGFTLAAGSSGTTINGFVVDGGAQPIFDAGINVTDNAGTGYTILNNLITDNNVGMYFHSTGGVRSRIQGNAFESNVEGGYPSPNTGTGIYTQLQTINDTTITSNFFSGQTDSDLNLGASAGGLVISKNQTLKDTTFLVLGNTTGAVVSGNSIQAPVHGSGLYIFGANSSLQIVNNQFKAAASEANTGTSGIRLTQNFGAATGNTGLIVSGNTAYGYDYGIHADSTVSSTFKTNKLQHSGVYGIWFESSVTGNTVTNNTANHSGTFDCYDQSTGTGTAGTANTWTHDQGSSASPPGICS